MLVPIRFEDRYDIMRWRNEQIYHLRQARPLNKKNQDSYFKEVVDQLFEDDIPSQILFSFLYKDTCVGYGGLVHINWQDANAEVSFLMDTAKEAEWFEEYWVNYLKLLQEVAFEDLSLLKIYTYAFDLRPNLYKALEKAEFKWDATLTDHTIFNGRPIDVQIHFALNKNISLREASIDDTKTTYDWATSELVRKYALSQDKISWSEHKAWFEGQIGRNDVFYYIMLWGCMSIGSFRLNLHKNNEARISYLLDPRFHGRGLGRKLMEQGISKAKSISAIKVLSGQVMKQNQVSAHLFNSLGFSLESESRTGLLTFKMKTE